MTVARGAPSLHRRVAAHASVLFIKFPVDLHDLAWRLGATGEEASAHDGIRQREGFHHIAGFGDASVGKDSDPVFGGGLRANIERGELWDSHASHHSSGANRARPLADFDRGRSTFCQKLDARGAGHIAGD